MIEWEKVPWTLWANFTLSLAGACTALIRGSVAVGLLAVGLAFTLVVNYFLFRGVRWLWLVLIGFGILGLLTNLVFGPRNYTLGTGLLSLVLLVLPVTRRFFAKQPST